jgi:hypothetical protein
MPRDNPLSRRNGSIVFTIQTAIEEQYHTRVRHDRQRSGIRHALASRHLDPGVGVAVVPVDEDFRVGAVTHDDGAVRPTNRRPDGVRACGRDRPISRLEKVRRRFVELERIVGDTVVDCIRDIGGVAQLVREEVFPVSDPSNRRHAGTQGVVRIGCVVDDGAPVDEVPRRLVGEFLAVERIPLIGVVDRQLVFVHGYEGLPHRGCAVGRVWWTASRDDGDEFPGEPSMSRA